MTSTETEIQGAPTPMRLNVGENWEVTGHVGPREPRPCDHDVLRASVMMRRVGWLDQKGRVWTEIPPSASFDGGSLDPLLIAVPCD